MHDIIVECAQLSLDLIEGSTEHDTMTTTNMATTVVTSSQLRTGLLQAKSRLLLLEESAVIIKLVYINLTEIYLHY